jgi:DNA gyrase inhibitor GyrI
VAVLKIEEYFLPTMSLRIAGGVPLSDWHSFGDPSGVNATHQKLNGFLLEHSLAPLRTFGLYQPPNELHVGYYAAAVEPGDAALDELEAIEISGGYYLCVEHVGPLTTLGVSMAWFYETFVPQSSYIPRAGHHLVLLDPRFDSTGEASVLTFGLPVLREGSEH